MPGAIKPSGLRVWPGTNGSRDKRRERQSDSIMEWDRTPHCPTTCTCSAGNFEVMKCMWPVTNAHTIQSG